MALNEMHLAVGILAGGATVFGVLWRTLSNRIDTKIESHPRWFEVVDRLARIETAVKGLADRLDRERGA